jgi:hypothetical protein
VVADLYVFKKLQTAETKFDCGHADTQLWTNIFEKFADMQLWKSIIQVAELQLRT